MRLQKFFLRELKKEEKARAKTVVKLAPIQTPLADINLFRDNDGESWIQQNNFTVSLGFNKFLSRNKKRGSGIGKFFHGEGVIKKFGNLNLINLRKLVDGILPQFIEEFYRNIGLANSSRRQFFKTNPKEIYHNAQTVLKILKDVLETMASDCFDPKSKEVKISQIGEFVVAEYYRRGGWTVEMHPAPFSNGAHPVDMLVKKSRLKQLVEVKTIGKTAHEGEGCFCIRTGTSPLSGLELNIDFAKKAELPLVLSVISQTDKAMYSADIRTLEKPITINGLSFPKFEDGKFIFHPKQFQKRPLTEEEIGWFKHYNTTGELPQEIIDGGSATQSERQDSHKETQSVYSKCAEKLKSVHFESSSWDCILDKNINKCIHDGQSYYPVCEIQKIFLGMDPTVKVGKPTGYGWCSCLAIGNLVIDAEKKKRHICISIVSLRDDVLPLFIDSLKDSDPRKGKAIDFLNALKKIYPPEEHNARNRQCNLFDNADATPSEPTTTQSTADTFSVMTDKERIDDFANHFGIPRLDLLKLVGEYHKKRQALEHQDYMATLS